jgi:hypothetical protein
MLVTIQIPIADIRYLLGSNVARLAKPAWPIPSQDDDFVRGLGRIERRANGGSSSVLHEVMYARADRAVKFPDGLPMWKGDGNSGKVLFRSSYRRFFYDGKVVARLELGFTPRGESNKLVSSEGLDANELLAALLSMPTTIKGTEESRQTSGPLSVSKELTRFLLRATSSKKDSLHVQDWWMISGEPVVVIERSVGEIISLPRSAKMLDIEGPAQFAPFFLRVWHRRMAVPVWILTRCEGNDEVNTREIRLCVLRLHAEIEVLKAVFRAIAIGQVEILRGEHASEHLQTYLRSALRFIYGTKQQRKSYGGISHGGVLDLAYRYFDLAVKGERASIIEALQDIRPNLHRLISEILENQSGRFAAGTGLDNRAIYFINPAIERLEMNETKIGDGNAIYGSAIGGNAKSVVADSITDSFNGVAPDATNEIKEVLETLAEQIKTFVSHAPEEKGVEAAALIQTINTQAVLPKPNKGLLELSAKELKNAAEAVAGMAGPIAMTLKALFDVLKLT